MSYIFRELPAEMGSGMALYVDGHFVSRGRDLMDLVPCLHRHVYNPQGGGTV